MKRLQILVATHKTYQMPEGNHYLPIHVGADLTKFDFGYTKDNTGDNISAKNLNYCELTALYWAWKNLDTDYIGLTHYRRHFSVLKVKPKSTAERFDAVLDQEEAEDLIEKHDIILPKARNYYIENLYAHYAHTMYEEPLEVTGWIIKEKYPQYAPEFRKLHTRTRAHMFNMFIMKREYYDAYCEWLFDILFELEKRIDLSQYDHFHARCMGRISELLLDVWINTNHLDYTEVPVIDIQQVNWLKKGSSFLAAKFFGRKYAKSF